MIRFASCHRLALVLAAVGLLSLAVPAAAGPTVPHKESCDGAVSFPSPGVLTFSGRGVATHMGRYNISGGNQITGDGRIINGTFTSIAADGSTISGTYSGTYVNLPNNRVRFDVTVHWLPSTGTRRLAGVSGVASVVALLDLNSNTYHYDTLGTWTFP
jgi:hypothetical protein